MSNVSDKHRTIDRVDKSSETSSIIQNDRPIRRHSSAVVRHASAHFMQCSMCLCLSHSAAHASQTFAQALQSCKAQSLFLDMNAAVVLHISAQSVSSRIHRTSILTSASLRHAFAHTSHVSAQELHRSIHFWYLSCLSTCITQSPVR